MNFNKTYHFFNKANSKEKLFNEEDDYIKFIETIKKHHLPFLNIYAYCLIPNHFHFLVKIKSEEEINENITVYLKNKMQNDVSKFIKTQLSHGFNSYTKWFNSKYNRKGGLFLRSFKYIEVTEESYYTQLIYYIHRNPIHHSLVEKVDDWKYSSYKTFLSESPTLIQRNEVLEWFRDKENFKMQHEEMVEDWKIEHLLME